MPAFVADLHNHTPASADHHQRGEVTPRDIVTSALDAGLDVYAATDHVDWSLSADLIEAAERFAHESGRRLFVVPGTELRMSYRGDEAHIVALFDIDRYESRFRALLAILGMTAALPGEHDLPFFTFEHDPVEACRAIDALGGIAVVAHADRPFGAYRLIDTPLFERLLAEPAVSAIDLVDPDTSCGRLDGSRKALITCSDSHSCHGIGARRTTLEMEGLSFEALRKALALGAVCSRHAGSTLNLA